MFEVYDNFLNSRDSSAIASALEHSEFPWYWNSYITREEELKTFGQFTHTLYKQNRGIISEWHNTFTGSVMNGIEILYPDKNILLLRSKMNLNLMRDINEPIGEYHTDWTFPGSIHRTAIYYCNTNNGFTEFETGEKFNSEFNRLVIFDGRIKHMGYTCTDQQTRVVLNVNYLLMEYETYE